MKLERYGEDLLAALRAADVRLPRLVGQGLDKASAVRRVAAGRSAGDP
jgi:hypothetical protein